MRTQLPPKELFIAQRSRLSELMPVGGLAVISSNMPLPANADAMYPFKQNSYLYYLTGILQEDTTLLMFPHASDPNLREVLFIKKGSEHHRIWEGDVLSAKEATSISGISTVYTVDDFESVVMPLMGECSALGLLSNEHPRASADLPMLVHPKVTWMREHFPYHPVFRLSPLLDSLRTVKLDYEIDFIKKAISITHGAFRRTLAYVRPGVGEYQIEAEITHEFISKGADGHAYAPILASGINACILHYKNNSQYCNSGDLLLMDFGAEYAHYCADLTRTIPVSGRFSPRQAQLYKAVLDVMRFAKSIMAQGLTLVEYHKEVGKYVESKCLEIGLLKKHEVESQSASAPLYKKYFMHGTSHYLGLDVHDVGSKYSKMKPGMVFTCEPGLYLRDEGIGIRLENNIWITDNGIVDLTDDIPLEIEEIEELMHKK